MVERWQHVDARRAIKRRAVPPTQRGAPRPTGAPLKSLGGRTTAARTRPASGPPRQQQQALSVPLPVRASGSVAVQWNLALPGPAVPAGFRPGCAGRKGHPGRPAEAVLETRRYCHAAERPAFCAGTGRGRPDLGSDMAGQRPAASRAGACGEHALTRALHVVKRDSHRERARAAAKTARVAPTLAHARTRRPTITRPRDSATNVRLRARTDDSDSGALARERRRAPTRARTRVDKRQRGAIRRPSIRHRIGRGRQWGSSGVTERGSPDPMSRNRKSRNRIHSGVRLPCCHRQLHSPMHG